MSTVVISLAPQERDRLPPAAEFETVEAWLGALPPFSSVLVTQGEGEFRMTVPYSVESVIDMLAAGPLYEQALREMGVR